MGASKNAFSLSKPGSLVYHTVGDNRCLMFMCTIYALTNIWEKRQAFKHQPRAIFVLLSRIRQPNSFQPIRVKTEIMWHQFIVISVRSLLNTYGTLKACSKPVDIDGIYHKIGFKKVSILFVENNEADF